MKTTKLVLIAAFVSFAMMSFASTELSTSKNVIHLKTAITNPEIAAAIQSQVEPSFFYRCKCSGIYTAEVRVRKTSYLVQASFSEWRIYFRKAVIKKPLPPIGPGGINPQEYNESPPVNPFSKANPFGNAGNKPVTKKIKPPLVDKH